MKIDFPQGLRSYIWEDEDLKKVLEAWEGYDELTKLIIISFSGPGNSIDFVLSLDTIIRNNKYNNKLKDILDE